MLGTFIVTSYLLNVLFFQSPVLSMFGVIASMNFSSLTPKEISFFPVSVSVAFLILFCSILIICFLFLSCSIVCFSSGFSSFILIGNVFFKNFSSRNSPESILFPWSVIFTTSSLFFNSRIAPFCLRSPTQMFTSSLLSFVFSASLHNAMSFSCSVVRNFLSGSPFFRYSSPFLSSSIISCGSVSIVTAFLFSSHCSALITSTSCSPVAMARSFRYEWFASSGSTRRSYGCRLCASFFVSIKNRKKRKELFERRFFHTFPGSVEHSLKRAGKEWRVYPDAYIVCRVDFLVVHYHEY